jgi:hypothetical protein
VTGCPKKDPNAYIAVLADAASMVWPVLSRGYPTTHKERSNAQSTAIPAVRHPQAQRPMLLARDCPVLVPINRRAPGSDEDKDVRCGALTAVAEMLFS